MKKFVLSFLLMAAIGCDSDPSLKQAGDAFEKAGESIDKAFSDIGDEGVRFNDNFNDAKEDAGDGLADANQTFNDEEHRFNQRVKDTGAKANADVLDEEARTTGRVKDTLEKANMDAVDEEHRFNDRFKTTSKKANMDTIAEGDKLTDRIVGSDDKTVDQHGDEIRDLQRRMALVEQMNDAQDAMLKLYLLQMQAGDQENAENIFVLRNDLSTLESRVLTSEGDISALQVLMTDVNLRLTSLESRATLTEGKLAQEILDRMAGDSNILGQLANEASIRAGTDLALGVALFAEALTRTIQINGLQTQIGIETAQRIIQDGILNGKILTEKTARQNADDALSAAIAAEAAARIAGDSDLADQLANEVAARQNAIAAEACARSTADAALQNEYDLLDGRVDALESAVSSSCTISVGAKSNTLYGCDGFSGFSGHCNDWERLKKATVTLQCLGKAPQVINDVLFRN